MKEREIEASDLQKSVHYVRWTNSPFSEKNPYYEIKEEMGPINTMMTNSKRKKDLRLATWNIRSLYRPGSLRITINELRKYKIAIAAIQETRWNKFTPQAFTSNGYNIYTSNLANIHEYGTAFQVNSKFNHMVKNFTPINERLCVIRIKGRFFNYSLINIHARTNDSEEEAKDQFFEQLERAYAAC
jgi:exonuclease III